MKDLNLVLDKLFKEKDGKHNYIFQKYQNLYDLPLTSIETDVSLKLYEYCKRKKYFILLLMYDDDGKVFLSRVMSDKLEWSLPGGSIRNDESIFAAVRRIALSVSNEISISNIEPISLIENKYIYKDNCTIHYGLGFIARIRDSKNINFEKTTGLLINANEEETKYINRSSIKEMIKIFQKRHIEDKEKRNYCNQEEEIETNEKWKHRYNFHDKFVKKYILTAKLKKKEKFYNLISEKIGSPSSIIDISCGDDSFVFKLSRNKNIDTIVGNDISWSQIERISEEYNEVLFTNHNAASLPFKKNTFDVVYCSNTLHHIPNKHILSNMLESMLNIGKKIVIVEIENPKITGGFPYLLNKYWYIKFLHDVGGTYLSFDEFKLILNSIFKDRATIKFDTFKNITGNYMIAEIIKEEK